MGQKKMVSLGRGSLTKPSNVTIMRPPSPRSAGEGGAAAPPPSPAVQSEGLTDSDDFGDFASAGDVEVSTDESDCCMSIHCYPLGFL